MIKLLLSLFVLMVTVALPVEASDKAKILVNITGLRNENGVVRVALFKDAASYKADKQHEGDGAFQKTIAKIQDKKSNCEFSDVPYGQYAVKFFHDEDNSGKFVAGTFGIPKVEFGFSNNASGMFGAPAFDKAKFDVNKPEVTLNLVSQSK